MYRGMQILSPNSLQNANWLYHENEEAKWTPEENKQFENALAVYDKDTPDRWVNVAALLPGKTIGDVIKQYKALEEDVSVIEAGGFPISGYSTDSFTLELVNNQALDVVKLPYYCVGEKRGTSTRASEQERKKGVPWTEEEHRYSIKCLYLFILTSLSFLLIYI